MQGIWKENLGGWNAKGNKRRKQTRNHTIKDKARAILRAYSEEHEETEKYKSDKNKLTNSSITKHITNWTKEKEIFPISVQYFKIRLYFDDMDGKSEIKTFRAFLHKGLWLTVDCVSVFNLLNLTWEQKRNSFFEKVKLLGEIKPDWTEQQKRKTIFNTSYWAEGTTYLYNKPLHDWKRWTVYNHNQRRKFALNKANSSDRMALQTYISNKDWDAEIKTHALSKSILWEIC